MLASLIDNVEKTTVKPLLDSEVERARAGLLAQIELSLNNSEGVGLSLSDWAAMGDWRLEVLDNRVGAPVPAQIVEWQLSLGVALPASPAEALASLRFYPNVVNNSAITNYLTPGTLRRRDTQYFYFDLCNNSTIARITLTGVRNVGGLELLADRSGFPTGDPARDDYRLLRNTIPVRIAGTTTVYNLTAPSN